MIAQAAVSDQSIPVVCVWCDTVIRREERLWDAERESHGTCQSCFRSMTEEHTRRSAQPHAQAHASDR
jgi:hypothetical protein